MNTPCAARLFRICLPLAAVLIVFLPAVSAAQEPVKSFELLGRQLSMGDRIRVTDGQGREVKGEVADIQPSSLVLGGDDPRTFQADQVRLIEKRKSKSVGRAALYGLLIGGAAGALLVAATEGECVSDCTGGGWAIGLGVGAGIGAGVGAAVRAAIPAGWKDVYRAPAPTASRLSLAPMITPRTKGVALAYSF
jgi:hypothetical protein